MDLNLPQQRTGNTDASIWRRAGALIIDLLIVNLVIISPFQKVFTKMIDPELSLTETMNQLQGTVNPILYWALIFIVMLTLTYFTIFQLKLKQTPGMMILKLKVKGKLTTWKTILRNLYLIPFFPFYILWIVEPLHLLLKGRRLLEEWTNTKTIMEVES